MTGGHCLSDHPGQDIIKTQKEHIGIYSYNTYDVREPGGAGKGAALCYVGPVGRVPWTQSWTVFQGDRLGCW